MTLMARIQVHTQQICGLAWSPNGELFASGGNDNCCCLFDARSVLNTVETPWLSTPRHHLGRRSRSYSESAIPTELLALGRARKHRFHERADTVQSTTSAPAQSLRAQSPPPAPVPTRVLRRDSPRHTWAHGAAVKAIAFCPWRDGLIATGGGSNDKGIHFFHTTSGAPLATIAVAAQVTSLIWSTTRREIAATFGYAQPEHPYRIAVFSWPHCRQVAAIPWEGDHRALYAIPYPSTAASVIEDDDEVADEPFGRDGAVTRGAAREGCIVIAASDESIKFHEVWTSEKKTPTGGVGMLCGSDILEGLEGIDKEGDVIR